MGNKIFTMCGTNHIDTVRIGTEVLEAAPDLTHHVILVGDHGRDYCIDQGVDFTGCEGGPRKKVSIKNKNVSIPTGRTREHINLLVARSMIPEYPLISEQRLYQVESERTRDSSTWHGVMPYSNINRYAVSRKTISASRMRRVGR